MINTMLYTNQIPILNVENKIRYPKVKIVNDVYL